jgi:hypothetical protein
MPSQRRRHKMLIRNKKIFSVGALFAITFLGVLILIFSPLFGGGKNGLQYSDDSFNKLAKGSSYFIPKVSKSVEKTVGKSIASTIKLESEEDAKLTGEIFTIAGAAVETGGMEVKITGDLGTILQAVLKDSDAMYKNDGKAVSDKYGHEEKKVMKAWWNALSRIEKNLKKEKFIEDAKVISEVNKKAVEPAYNFYHVDAQRVIDHAGMMSGLLVFYVLYTMWWGYAIFYLFEGVGLSMKKAKVKKEA